MPDTPAARPDALRRQALSDFLTLSALWGASFLFMRLAANEFGALPTAGLRVGIAALFLLPVLLYNGQWPALRAHLRPILFVGLLNSGIPFALLAWAVLSLSTGMTSILNATVPMFGALVAWIWLKDKPNASRLLGLAIGFAGVALLAWDKASFKPGGTGWAVVACLVATMFYGIGASYTKRYLTGVNSLALATGSQIGATLGLLVPTLWLWPAATPGLRAWGAVVGLAVLCTGIAYILYFRLIANAGPARALAVTFLIPVFAVVYGAIALGESITLWMLLCGAVIVLGTALATGLLKVNK